MAVALAKRQGARRIFVAGHRRRPLRLEVARQFGADTLIDPAATPLAQYKFDCPIDRIMVTAPPPTITEAIALAANGAIITFIGLGFGAKATVQFDANAFHYSCNSGPRLPRPRCSAHSPCNTCAKKWSMATG